MQTHPDSDFEAPMDPVKHSKFIKTLQRRAEDSAAAGGSPITTGRSDETPIRDWEARGGMHIRQMPDDPQDILRISIGGGVPGIDINYCTIRGDREACIALLNKALNALSRGPR